MAVLHYTSVGIVSLIAGVTSFCGNGKQECFPYCCSANEICMVKDGARMFGHYCRDPRTLCPANHVCCTDLAVAYCCPTGQSCDRGQCSPNPVQTTTQRPELVPTADENMDPNQYYDEQNTFNDRHDNTTGDDSNSGFKWHYAVGGGGSTLIVIPLCIIVRRRRVLVARRTVVTVRQVPAGRSAVVVSNAGQSAVANPTASIAGSSHSPSYSITSGSSHSNPSQHINLDGIGVFPCEPPPYSEFVDDRDKTKLHNSNKTEEA